MNNKNNNIFKNFILEKNLKINNKLYLFNAKKSNKYLNEIDCKNNLIKIFINDKIRNNNIYLYNHLLNIINNNYNEAKNYNISKNNISNYFDNYIFIPYKFSDEIFNNAIKIQKNYNMEYMNTLVKSNKIKKNNLNIKRKRSSQYRGVSKNGNHWQALMMNKRNKSYIGTYNSEELAARIYDFMAIKKKGIMAKTNFFYNDRQIKNIILKDIDFKTKNIDKTINQFLYIANFCP